MLYKLRKANKALSDLCDKFDTLINKQRIILNQQNIIYAMRKQSDTQSVTKPQ